MSCLFNTNHVMAWQRSCDCLAKTGLIKISAIGLSVFSCCCYCAVFLPMILCLILKNILIQFFCIWLCWFYNGNTLMSFLSHDFGVISFTVVVIDSVCIVAKLISCGVPVILRILLWNACIYIIWCCLPDIYRFFCFLFV